MADVVRLLFEFPFTYRIRACFFFLLQLNSMHWCNVSILQAFFIDVCYNWCHRRQRTYKSSFERTKTNQKKMCSQFILFRVKEKEETLVFVSRHHCVVFALLICNLLHVTWDIFMFFFLLLLVRRIMYKQHFDASWNIHIQRQCITRRPNLIALFI